MCIQSHNIMSDLQSCPQQVHFQSGLSSNCILSKLMRIEICFTFLVVELYIYNRNKLALNSLEFLLNKLL